MGDNCTQKVMKMTAGLPTLIDLSHAISGGDLVWPGDPPTEITPVGSGQTALNRLSFSEHSGTHIGAPSHHGFDQTMDDFDLSLATGQVLFLHLESVALRPIGALEIDAVLETLDNLPDQPYQLVTAVTGWAKWWGSEHYYPSCTNTGSVGLTDYQLPAGLDASAVCRIIERLSPSIIGIDSPNMDFGGSALGNLEAGSEMARHGLFHLENIAAVPSDLPAVMNYLLLPLKIEKGSGSPVRLVVY